MTETVLILAKNYEDATNFMRENPNLVDTTRRKIVLPEDVHIRNLELQKDIKMYAVAGYQDMPSEYLSAVMDITAANNLDFIDTES